MRLVLLVVMASSLLMAVAIPEAFGRLAPLFACSYVLLQVVRNAFNVYATPRDNPFYIIFRRILAWSLVSGVLWLAGGFAPSGARTWLWIAALAVDYVAPSVGYWTPRLGRSGTTEWEIEAAHFAERFQLFIIIALGESIVVTGATASSLVLDFANGTALMVAFGTSAALWWLYFDEVGWRAQRFLSRSHDSGRLARDAYTYLHIPIVAGIIVVAVGDELVIAHPGASPSGVELAVILGGPALYLVGHTLFRLRMIHNVSRKRVVAMVAILALALARRHAHIPGARRLRACDPGGAGRGRDATPPVHSSHSIESVGLPMTPQPATAGAARDQLRRGPLERVPPALRVADPLLLRGAAADAEQPLREQQVAEHGQVDHGRSHLEHAGAAHELAQLVGQEGAGGDERQVLGPALHQPQPDRLHPLHQRVQAESAGDQVERVRVGVKQPVDLSQKTMMPGQAARC